MCHYMGMYVSKLAQCDAEPVVHARSAELASDKEEV